MGRFRAGAFLGTAVSGIALALAIANCAAPTQIIVDVRTDRSLCASISTGIAVTTLDHIDTDQLEIYENGCEDGTDRVGTLTITPSGSNDDMVGIRVIGAVNDQDPDACGLPGGPNGEPVWADCILARRRVRFVPGKTVNITVRLTERCVDRYCGGDLECNLGVCVQPEQVQPDGGNRPPEKDGELPIEDADIPDGAPLDAPADVVDNDACARCNGTSCSAGECRVDCNVLDCEDKSYCADGLDCVIECAAADKCKNTRCATNGTCTFNCVGPNGKHCEDIACSAATCNVNCRNAEGTCDGVYVDGGTNVVRCSPTADAKATCNDVECRGGTCTRTCGDGGCGPDTFCAGSCAAWEDAGASN